MNYDTFNFKKSWHSALKKYNVSVNNDLLKSTNDESEKYLYDLFTCAYLNILDIIAERFVDCNYTMPVWLCSWIKRLIVDIMWYVYITLYNIFYNNIYDFILSKQSKFCLLLCK